MNDSEAIDEVIDGTFCKECYLVFAKTPGFKIGIRPLASLMADTSFFGFRIRAVPDGQDADFSGGKNIAEAFPGFEFQKNSSVRASLVGGLYVNLSGSQVLAVQDFVSGHRVVAKVITAMRERLGDIPLLNEEALYEFIKVKFNELIESTTEGFDQEKENDGQFTATIIHMDQWKAEKALEEAIDAPVDSYDDGTEVDDGGVAKQEEEVSLPESVTGETKPKSKTKAADKQ